MPAKPPSARIQMRGKTAADNIRWFAPYSAKFIEEGRIYGVVDAFTAVRGIKNGGVLREDEMVSAEKIFNYVTRYVTPLEVQDPEVRIVCDAQARPSPVGWPITNLGFWADKKPLIDHFRTTDAREAVSLPEDFGPTIDTAQKALVSYFSKRTNIVFTLSSETRADTLLIAHLRKTPWLRVVSEGKSQAEFGEAGRINGGETELRETDGLAPYKRDPKSGIKKVAGANLMM